MNNKYLLDCTLRDGGYINDWEFGHDNIVNIFERVVSSKVEFIEIGFLDERRIFDVNHSIMPDTKSVKSIYGKLDRKNSMVLGMIDFGTCDISNIEPKDNSYLDGIRVIFKKNNLYPAFKFCRELKKLGYMVFAQLVSITAYSDEELLEVIKLANDIMPYAISIVDTYGLLNPSELRHIMEILDEGLNSQIVLGFHAHNNFQLGYTNATTALVYKTDRDILVDGTLYGMGKSAGNAPLELIAMYMNEHLGKQYVITEMQEAIVTSVTDFQRKSPWGYQLFYYIAAVNKVHPDYVSFLMNKRTLSITSINEILSRIPREQKLEKNIKLVEQLYLDYQTHECDDENSIISLEDDLIDKEIIVIGPGGSIGKYNNLIREFISAKKPVVISINYIPKDFHPDYLFMTNNTRYLQSATKLLDLENSDIKLIATSNLTSSDRHFDYVINYSAVIDEQAEFPDNSMCMLLRVLMRCGCRSAVLAGFDGYTAESVNYFDIDKEYSFLKEKADSLNQYAIDFFEKLQMNIIFLTPSEYEKN